MNPSTQDESSQPFILHNLSSTPTGQMRARDWCWRNEAEGSRRIIIEARPWFSPSRFEALFPRASAVYAKFVNFVSGLSRTGSPALFLIIFARYRGFFAEIFHAAVYELRKRFVFARAALFHRVSLTIQLLHETFEKRDWTILQIYKFTQIDRQQRVSRRLDRI